MLPSIIEKHQIWSNRTKSLLIVNWSNIISNIMMIFRWSCISLFTWSLYPLFFINFFLSLNGCPWKIMKNVFFHLKSSYPTSSPTHGVEVGSFRFRDIQFFLFPSSPLFLPVSHCFRGCSKMDLKVYDIINSY